MLVRAWMDVHQGVASTGATRLKTHIEGATVGPSSTPEDMKVSLLKALQSVRPRSMGTVDFDWSWSSSK